MVQSLLAGVSVPLFDGGAARAQVRVQEAGLEQARVAYEATVLQALKDVEDALIRVGGAPVIIKLLEGTQGVGVILADKIEIAKAIVETLQSSKQQVLLQKFVSESKGKDVRAFVIGIGKGHAHNNLRCTFDG